LVVLFLSRHVNWNGGRCDLGGNHVSFLLKFLNGFPLLSLKVSLDIGFLWLRGIRLSGGGWSTRMLALTLISTSAVLLGRILCKRIELVLLSSTTSAVD
jgi:hypothetical protein